MAINVVTLKNVGPYMHPKFMEYSTPTTRAEFEERIHLLKDHMINGKIKIASHLTAIPESLLAVRYLPNRRIDLLSINEMARLQGNMLHQFHTEEVPDLLMDNQGEAE